jgi:hypothetical protein
MRHLIQQHNNKVITIQGQFERYGKMQGRKDLSSWTTVLLTNIYFPDGKKACDHLWFVAKKSFLNVRVEEASIIEVTGVVSCYRRKNGSYDYGIQDYSRVKVVKNGNGIVPAKRWVSNGYKYYKFITDEGTKWFRVKDMILERVIFKFISKRKGFEEVKVLIRKNDGEIVHFIRKEHLL